MGKEFKPLVWNPPSSWNSDSVAMIWENKYSWIPFRSEDSAHTPQLKTGYMTTTSISFTFLLARTRRSIYDEIKTNHGIIKWTRKKVVQKPSLASSYSSTQRGPWLPLAQSANKGIKKQPRKAVAPTFLLSPPTLQLNEGCNNTQAFQEARKRFL